MSRKGKLSRGTQRESKVSTALKERVRHLRNAFDVVVLAAHEARESQSKLERWERRNPFPDGVSRLMRTKQRKHWDRRQAFLRRLKLGAKKQAHTSSWEAYTHALEQFAKVQAKTVFELLFKAEVSACFDHFAAGRPVAQSVAKELLSISEKGAAAEAAKKAGPTRQRRSQSSLDGRGQVSLPA